MHDIIEKFGNSVIQHGKHNSRIYIMSFSKEDFPSIIDKLDLMAIENGYSKIFAKIPSFAMPKFVENGYRIEASIPHYNNGKQDKFYFLGKYFDKSRMIDVKNEDINKILKIACSKENIYENIIKFDLPNGYEYKMCDKSHARQIADVYSKVFSKYPFPIFDPEYIMKTMNENFVYFSIQKDNKIVALSSYEMDNNLKNVEMTDFATLPDHRGKGFAFHLLYKMEQEMIEKDMKIMYTISRAMSYGINIIFAKMGYIHGGTLSNNTSISDKSIPDNFESMNVWYKIL